MSDGNAPLGAPPHEGSSVRKPDDNEVLLGRIAKLLDGMATAMVTTAESIADLRDRVRKIEAAILDSAAQLDAVIAAEKEAGNV